MGSSSAERMRALRARRAASIEAAPDDRPRDPDEMLVPAVEESLTALRHGPEHAGAIQLARRYAKVIDQAKDPAYAARWLGPLLLDCLVQLQATPSARPKQPPEPGPNRLDQLRAARGASDRSRGRL